MYCMHNSEHKHKGF
uniref:Uncharacterized protein n=1 Tax=Anguilla anguilla TaxID=7936 RepID=A0A0E9UXQ9_ANGAN